MISERTKKDYRKYELVKNQGEVLRDLNTYFPKLMNYLYEEPKIISLIIQNSQIEELKEYLAPFFANNFFTHSFVIVFISVIIFSWSWSFFSGFNFDMFLKCCDFIVFVDGIFRGITECFFEVIFSWAGSFWAIRFEFWGMRKMVTF